MTLISNSAHETTEIGKNIGSKLKPGDIIALKGDLASGKTILTKGIAISLEVIEHVTSPTYNIICEYNGKIPLYHMDLYRISDYEEFEMLGVDHLLFGKGITVIEWSERIQDELPDSVITIDIRRNPITETRNIEIKGLKL